MRGRRPLPDQARKSEVVKIRVSADLADALYRRAIAEGQSLSAFLRRHLIVIAGQAETIHVRFTASVPNFVVRK